MPKVIPQLRAAGQSQGGRRQGMVLSGMEVVARGRGQGVTFLGASDPARQ